MVTVDEAHCISQWGRTSAPATCASRHLWTACPSRPVVGAFTATATAHVAGGHPHPSGNPTAPYEVTTSFDRPNLYFATRRALPSAEARKFCWDLVLREGDNAGIVYCSTTRQVDETARLLQSRGIRAAAYHAKLDARASGGRIRTISSTTGCRSWWRPMPSAWASTSPTSGSSSTTICPRTWRATIRRRAVRAATVSQPVHPALIPVLDVRTIRFFIDKEMEADNGLPADVKAEAARKAEERLKYMTFYSTTPRCLRGILLSYFGEAAPEVRELLQLLCWQQEAADRTDSRRPGQASVPRPVQASGAEAPTRCPMERSSAQRTKAAGRPLCPA